MVGDSVDYFCIDNHRIEYDQVGDKQTNLASLVEHIENRLLPKWNLPCSKFHDQRVFIRFFNDAVAESIQNFDCTRDDLINFVLE